VPFENLSIHLGEPVSLDERDLIGKIVGRRRGGFCYELNGAFALLLEALGAQVSRVAARVYGEAGLGPPFDHLALIVRPAGGSGPWLADVGFGSHSDFPLLLDRRDDQDDPPEQPASELGPLLGSCAEHCPADWVDSQGRRQVFVLRRADTTHLIQARDAHSKRVGLVSIQPPLVRSSGPLTRCKYSRWELFRGYLSA
jgi:hypothetical protein